MEKDDTALKVLALPVVLLIALFIAIPFALFNAFVVLNLYNWFIYEQIANAPALNIWHTWGIMILLSRINLKIDIENKDANKSALNLVVYVFSGLLALLIGFIIKGFI